MRHADQLESAGEGLAQPPLDEQGRRSEQHNFQRELRGGVFVPEQLGQARPLGDLLYLIEHQHGSPPATIAGRQPADLPLRSKPGEITAGGVVGGGVVRRECHSHHGLLDQCRLPHLTRAGENLDESARFPQPLQERRQDRAAELHFRSLLNVLSKSTQHAE